MRKYGATGINCAANKNPAHREPDFLSAFSVYEDCGAAHSRYRGGSRKHRLRAGVRVFLALLRFIAGDGYGHSFGACFVIGNIFGYVFRFLRTPFEDERAERVYNEAYSFLLKFTASFAFLSSFTLSYSVSIVSEMSPFWHQNTSKR